MRKLQKNTIMKASPGNQQWALVMKLLLMPLGIQKDYYKVVKVDLKPLDISPHCKSIFEKASKTLIMSATILNLKAFCKSVGISLDDVRYIQVQSDFPAENRVIYPLN